MVSTGRNSFGLVRWTMLNSTQLEVALAPDRPWKSAYAIVEGEARYYLDALLVSSPGYSTAALAGAIYGGDVPWIRKRVFKALAALSTRSLQRYVRLGDPEKMPGRPNIVRRRKTWGYPSQEIIPPCKTCPTCKRPL